MAVMRCCRESLTFLAFDRRMMDGRPLALRRWKALLRVWPLSKTQLYVCSVLPDSQAEKRVETRNTCSRGEMQRSCQELECLVGKVEGPTGGA